jgi:chromosomal replication initiation ATPase DnaA
MKNEIYKNPYAVHYLEVNFDCEYYLNYVSQLLKVSKELIISKKRSKNLFFSRLVYFYFAKKNILNSKTKIMETINRDRSLIYHYEKTIQNINRDFSFVDFLLDNGIKFNLIDNIKNSYEK